MKATVILKKLITGACVYYAAASLIVLVTAALIRGDLNGTVAALNYLMLFPFGLALSAAGMLVRCGRLPGWGRWLLHFLITLAAFFCFLWLPSNANAGASSVLMVLLLLIQLGYIRIALIAETFQFFGIDAFFINMIYIFCGYLFAD